MKPATTQCACGATITQIPGPGRIKKTCDTCRANAHTPRTPNTTGRKTKHRFVLGRPTSPIYRTKKYSKERAALIAAFRPGQPCVLCGHAMHTTRYAEAQHIPGTDTLLGLCHGTRQPCPTCGKRCNQSEGARRGAQKTNNKKQSKVTTIRWYQPDVTDKTWLKKDFHPCPICNTTVEWASQEHCTRACSSERYRRMRLSKDMCPQWPPPPPPPTHTYTCQRCGDAFTSRISTTVLYCSKRCGDAVYAQRKIQREKEDPNRLRMGSACSDCGGPIAARRWKCDRCVETTRREAKRRERHSEGGRRRARAAYHRRMARTNA